MQLHRGTRKALFKNSQCIWGRTLQINCKPVFLKPDLCQQGHPCTAWSRAAAIITDLLCLVELKLSVQVHMILFSCLSHLWCASLGLGKFCFLSPPLLITTPYHVAKLCLWQGFATCVGTSESTAALALLQHSWLHQVPRALLACWAQPRLLHYLLLTPRLGTLLHLGFNLLTQSVAFWECRGYSELCFSAAVAHPGVLI